MIKKYSLNRILLLLTALGFLFLFLDTTLEHWAVFGDELPVYIPAIFSVVGTIFCLLTVYLWKENLIKYLKYFLFTSIIVAFLGTYFHVLEEEDDEDITLEQKQHEEEEGEKPLLAPLSFAGLALFGLIATSNEWKEETMIQKKS
jgi:hypothetical protein